MMTEQYAQPWRGPRPRRPAKLAALCAAVLVLWLGAADGAHAAADPGAPGARGAVAQVEPIASYGALRLKVLLLAVGLHAQVSNGIHLYRLSYWSVSDGAPVLVSGLMTVPDGVAPRGVVIWMHGTHDARADSLSNPGSEEGLLASAVFAGGGYLLLAPDLVGLGVSKGPQTYFVNTSTVDVTLDLLRAAKDASAEAGRPWNASLYLTGFSEGGHAAALLQRTLEQHPDPAWHVVAGVRLERPRAGGRRLSGDRVAVVFHLLPPAPGQRAGPTVRRECGAPVRRRPLAGRDRQGHARESAGAVHARGAGGLRRQGLGLVCR
jgi:hypothetical protein